MTDGLTRRHLIKVVLIVVMLTAVSVMIGASPEQYIYGGF